MSALLLRLDTRDGMTKWRPFRDHEHASNPKALCESFGLPETVRFDLSRSFRGDGASSTTQGRHGLPQGFVFQGGDDTPIGVLTITSAREQFRDRDPGDPRDLFALDSKLR